MQIKEEYSNHYYVTPDGEVYSVRKLKPRPGNGGYLRVMLYNRSTKKGKDFSIHRLVAEGFIPNPENLPEVNHKNSDRSDNRVENLEWCTKSYNIQHAYRKGKKSIKGVLNGRSTLTEVQVKEIRAIYEDGEMSYIQIAERFHSKKSTISNIIKRNTWKHI